MTLNVGLDVHHSSDSHFTDRSLSHHTSLSCSYIPAMQSASCQLFSTWLQRKRLKLPIDLSDRLDWSVHSDFRFSTSAHQRCHSNTLSRSKATRRNAAQPVVQHVELSEMRQVLNCFDDCVLSFLSIACVTIVLTCKQIQVYNQLGDMVVFG